MDYGYMINVWKFIKYLMNLIIWKKKKHLRKKFVKHTLNIFSIIVWNVERKFALNVL